ncbi:MAG: Bax inhibitor-1 family protein [Planctomycetota bacterium]
MSQQIPEHEMTQDLFVAQAEQWERIGFLQRTYSWVLLGIAVFSGVLFAIDRNLGGFGQWSMSLLTSMNPIILILVLLGSAYAVRALARKPGIGVIGYLAYAALLGIFIAPLVILSTGNVIAAAAITTTCVFLGLTAYVFITKQDFSWMRGILTTVLFGMIGVGICALIFGFQLGFLFNLVGALLFSGYILYDTSNILHHHRSDEALPAAIELFVDVVLLFWYLLALFNRD